MVNDFLFMFASFCFLAFEFLYFCLLDLVLYLHLLTSAHTDFSVTAKTSLRPYLNGLLLLKPGFEQIRRSCLLSYGFSRFFLLWHGSMSSLSASYALWRP